MPSQRATSRASSAKTSFSYASIDEPGRKILYQGLEHNEERAGVSLPPPPWHAVCCARTSLCTRASRSTCRLAWARTNVLRRCRPAGGPGLDA